MKTLIAILVIFCTGPVFAVEDTPQSRSKEADRYIAATAAMTKELVANTIARLATRKAGSGKGQAYTEVVMKNLDFAAINQAAKEAMVKIYTTEELKALADLYESPVGQSALKKAGAYGAELQAGCQAEFDRAAAKTKKDYPQGLH